jgi:hypothetical protein
MFSIVKFMNQAHRDYYIKEPVEQCAFSLLKEMGINAGAEDPAELLQRYRSMEKNA